MDIKKKTCFFTGHRILPMNNLLEIQKCLEDRIISLINQGIIYFKSGGAIEFDTIASLTILRLKENYPFIKLILVLPCKEQDKYWTDYNKCLYKYILEKTDEIIYVSEKYYKGCMHKRNRYLAECSCYCIAYLNEQKSGTAYTVNYARKKNVNILNVAALV